MKYLDFSRVSVLVFDLDGTLADTIPAIRHAMNDTLVQYGYPSREYDQIRLAIGNGARKLVARSMPPDAAEDAEMVSAVLATYDRRYADTFAETDVCYAGIQETVVTLAREGYRICVLSNKQDPYVKRLVARLLPEGIVSYALGQGELPVKPDPAGPRFLMERLGVDASACLMIGDSAVDVETARNAAMCGVVGCSWGFRGRAALEKAGADYVIDRPEELLTILGKR